MNSYKVWKKRSALSLLNSTKHISRSVDLFHLGSLISSTLNLLQRRQVVVITKAIIIVIDAKAKLDHSVDSASELSWLIKVETRSEQRCVKQEPDQILDGLVGLVSRGLLPELRMMECLGFTSMVFLETM